MSRFSNTTALLRFGHFRRVQFPNDGNSFYRAIAQDYYKNQDFHLLLRRSLVEDIQYDKDYISKFPILHNMSSILHEHKRKYHWHTDLEPVILHAMSQFLNLCLEIYSENDNKMISKTAYTPRTSSQTVRLFQTANQFELLIKS